MTRCPVVLLLAVLLPASVTVAQSEIVGPPVRPSGSLLVRQGARHDPLTTQDHQLHLYSPFSIAKPEPRRLRMHDLVQIVVRETSRASRTQDLDTSHEWGIDGRVSAFPDLNLWQLLQLRTAAGRTTGLPEVRMDFTREFTGEGDYQRSDDISDRLTAEIIEVLPNGNLVLEARTTIITDQERSLMRVTGICRPEDVSVTNTILSNQIHDLNIERTHEGELPRSNEKGLIARVLEAVFAF